jgi:Fe-S-cluster-containing dehydrogenase component/CRP-like cAMP-binding protein
MQRPERWHNPFSPDMNGEEVRMLLSKPPLNEIDRDKFPQTAALDDIIRNDTRLRRFRRGDIVVREDDYGNSAFVVLSGSVRVILKPRLPAKALGRQETRRRSFWQALSQLWTNPATPERHRIGGDGERPQAGAPGGNGRRRESGRRAGASAVGLRRTRGDEFLMTLLDPAAVVQNHLTVQIGPGEMFGEIAAVSRSPRTATIFSETESELLEIRWQGLRDIRRRDTRFREKVDTLYRKHSLEVQFRESPLFARLDEELLHEVANHTEFASFGEFDWHTSYKALAAKEAVERLVDEPIIVSEDQVADTLFLVRSGFARISERVDHGHRTVSYLGPGDMFGLAEIVHNWRNQANVTYQHTLRATGSVDVLRVPAHIVERHVLPELPDELLPPPLTPRRGSRSAWQRDDPAKKIEPAMLEFLVDNRFINGTAAMVIDVDRCTRCDECVKACAATHNNNPRFVLHGPQYGHFMIANACMHCADPVCMIGCPTGAIHRNVSAGQVIINDETCIGCGVCANSCPYNNIRMVDIRDDLGDFIVDKESYMPLERATKCDLCADQMGGPACQRACPNDALVRLNLRDLDSLAEWTNR